MTRAIVFDFDGVLVDSVEIKTKAFARIFESEGPEVVKRVVAYHLENGGLSRTEKFSYYYSQILQRPLPADELDELCKRFQDLVFEEVVKAPWVAGAPAVLDHCRARDYLLFVVSGTPEEEIRLITERRGISSYFSGIYGSPTKKEALLRAILKRYGLAPEQVLYIGDSRIDYEAAREVGVYFLAVAGTDAEGEWRKLGVRSLRDLVGLPEAMAMLVPDLGFSVCRDGGRISS